MHFLLISKIQTYFIDKMHLYKLFRKYIHAIFGVFCEKPFIGAFSLLGKMEQNGHFNLYQMLRGIKQQL
jgi:hypothetical protein